MEPAPLHQIGEVAETVGLSLRTIRHYEEVGLVSPTERSGGGFRLYSDADIQRLRLVKQLKPLQFSLEELSEIITIRDELAGRRAEGDNRRRLKDRLAAFAVVADQRCEHLRAQIAAAEDATAELHRRASSSHPSASAAR